jgi:DNA-binding NarL/FixJ family response regulator
LYRNLQRKWVEEGRNMPTEAVSGDSVVVIDLMEFRRALVVRFLTDWSVAEKVQLLSFVPEDAHRALRTGIDCRMIIFNARGASCSSAETLAEITVLRALAPSAPLVVLADEEVPEDVVAVMQSGAEGYLSNHSAPDLVLRALSFVLKGGTYVPRSAVAHMPFPDEVALKGDHEVHGALIDEVDEAIGNLSPPARAVLSSSSRLELSVRQQAILEGLCRGEPNKIIGRALNLPESTVKVHVREIMRKLAVSNRTQVAVVASRMGVALGEKQALTGYRQNEGLSVAEQSACSPPSPATETRTNVTSNVRPLNGLPFRNLVESKVPKTG